MNTKILFILTLIISGVVIFAFTIKTEQTPTQKDSNSKVTQIVPTTKLLNPQTKTMGYVEVAIIPTVPIPREKMVFQVSLNTHSVELDYDYTQIVTLSDDQGNTYNPLEWTGGNGGHHLEGDLIFEPLTKGVKIITLNIDGIDNQQVSFEWDL